MKTLVDAQHTIAPAPAPSEGIRKRKRTELKYGLLFASPVLLGYLAFVLGPLVITFALGFTEYSMVGTPKFVGLDNFTRLFTGKEPLFYDAVVSTFYYVMVSVPLGIVFSFVLALLLNSKIKGRAFFRGLFYLPVIIPLAASSVIWLWMLQPDFGVVNYVLGLFGVPKIPWLSSDSTVIPTLILFSLWMTGNTMVIFLAGLQNIPSHLYEAIEVDGGNTLHKIWYITLPMSSSIIFFNTVIGFVNAFQTFVQPAVMTQGGPNNASYLIVYYLFKEGFQFTKFGTASAAAFLLFLIILLCTAVLFKFSDSLVYYEGQERGK
ncbi:sugar ABC transporter permease [Paenibacillus faecis]|uniref:carbohydrate ABC transporter permease n=1 Tax=Paenibacillus faecis TaxID=862114 RepID=UPI001B0CE5DE|nr:sugar ABC transporter permease [Paenibacillus faecis]GIO83205.1 sugar ABC transporter permease [Paenibacillus faecis]